MCNNKFKLVYIILLSSAIVIIVLPIVNNMAAKKSTMNTNHKEKLVKPKLIVFDLDYTLWPFWCDTHVSPPFSMKGNVIYDGRKREVKCYPDVPEVLKYLNEENIKVGAASRTTETDIANRLIDLFGWEKFFHNKQIFPGCKVTHFERLKKATGFEYRDMIFFDDEDRNIRDVGKLGVTCVLVNNGVTMKLFQNTLKEFSESYYANASAK